MISLSILGFALALSVAVAGVVLSITCWRRIRALELASVTTANSLRALAARLHDASKTVEKLKSGAPTALHAQVVELSDAVARLAKTQQRFAGKFYASGGPAAREEDHAAVSNGETDDDLTAILALQSAPSAAPGAQ